MPADIVRCNPSFCLGPCPGLRGTTGFLWRGDLKEKNAVIFVACLAILEVVMCIPTKIHHNEPEPPGFESRVTTATDVSD